jgi:hypothetical protein
MIHRHDVQAIGSYAVRATISSTSTLSPPTFITSNINKLNLHLPFLPSVTWSRLHAQGSPDACRCMGIEDSTAPSTPIDGSAASAAATLSTFDAAALRRDFERLSVDDLTALASFPGEPHELIGRVVAVTHCLLLSLAPEHTTLELRAPPWPLLRLQWLDSTLKIWRKLRKRAWQLEARVKLLSPAQVRLGCKELLPFLLPAQHPTRRDPGAWQLANVAQVSTIAASLGAWVVYCLGCSVSSQVPPRESHQGPSLQPPLSVTLSSGAPHVKPVPCQSSSRIGLKAGGRFLLLHTRFPTCPSVPQATAAAPLGEWAVYCLAANRIGRKLAQHSRTSSPKTFSLDASWWKPLHAIATQPSRQHPVVLSRMPALAQQSLLLQLGAHERTFERPVRDIPHWKTPRLFAPVFTLKFDVVVADSQAQLSLLGIGDVCIMMDATVAELRLHLLPAVASRLRNPVDQHSNVRFLYRGSLLAASQERHLAAVALLPFAMLVLVHSSEVRQHRPSLLWRHQSEVTQSLVNVGIPDNLHVPAAGATTFAPQVFAMRQPLTWPAADQSSGTRKVSTSSAIVEMFTHWQAFVCFQQLQKSSVLFQLPQRSPNKHAKSPPRLPKPGRNNGHEEDSVPYGPQPMPLPRKVRASKSPA